MKKIISVVLFLITLNQLQAQYYNYADPNQALLKGGLGMSFIDGKAYYTVRLRPEIAFSKIGVGLDLNLEFDSEGKLRKENFNEFSDYLSIIRYVRYGYKRDPMYGRLGALDYASLGHGSIMYMYNNSPSFDVRKIGLEFDLDFDSFGFESVYGNFAQAGVTGLRGYIRPLKYTTLGQIPLLSNFEVGATVVSDFNKYSGVTNARFDSLNNNVNIIEDKGALTVIGFDIGLPLKLADFFTLTPYFDYAKIIDFGSGTAAGLMLDFHGLGLVDARAKLERRFNGDHYMPSYFNMLYEIERVAIDNASSTFSSKAALLNSSYKVGNGFYGELLVRVLNMFDILGSYQRLDDHPNSGILHVAADVSPKDFSYVARVGYDKTNIGKENDIFTLDDRSYLYAEAGYKPLPYMIVSMVYQWTFSPIRDADDRVIDYKPQKRIEPRISFVYPLNFGNGQ